MNEKQQYLLEKAHGWYAQSFKTLTVIFLLFVKYVNWLNSFSLSYAMVVTTMLLLINTLALALKVRFLT